MSRWSDALGRLGGDRTAQRAREDSDQATRWGGTACSELTGRLRATVCGTVTTVTLRPQGDVPALEAELSDGTGSLVLVWLGRRSIPGVEPGARLRVEGFVACRDARKMLYNPRYELAPRVGA